MDDETPKRQLKRAKNSRHITPRVCATCHFHKLDDGASYCTRPNSPDFGDAGDMLAWFYTCDRWQKQAGQLA